jgi:hypothetical protein
MIYLFSGRSRRYLWLLLLGLPLCWIVNQYVKPSAALFVGAALGIPQGLGPARPAWFTFILIMLTPVLEELIKVLPLLLPAARSLVQDSRSAFWTGITLGVGFGLGEVGFVAWGVTQVSDYAGLPWYAFTGFMSERLAICLLHGVMTAIFLLGLEQGGWRVAAGFLGAISLHALTNAGPILYGFGLIAIWAASLWEGGAFILAAYLFEMLRRKVTAQSGAVPVPGEIVYWTRGKP